ncbi:MULTISPECIES: SDR family NAD(P)-dependent oxidoreductase [unclassified Variovorax]|jgi:NAD(P)-dependent dehydrogenase (short-subunit alcohol dehydrogenase family)|uniref:SDR family NAD(P)-dependent oxidoreductase n=1 Tax=unclassified Variovorax TaxID=663243 RepID=UPI00086903CC|nr:MULTISPECIES: SDR family NAD(P)-dependent oxidoreductase [unclassified Variovorax]MBN8758475.1 SDR family oxidoreductase [Variovorax sp.]ODU18867.1 MAG: short-chain dehydrogenase [Variovorax sp. SCN 67-85]ODV18301.1 MAG: short-chain dehydrogenase [Variovorax sp. SCN 67-20]OJZ05850.1 MAG: short-chain dehydrogenase [Variovorax sp. 67-131]
MSVIIVTGGTFGLGQSITVELARRGHQVVGLGLAQPQVSSTAQGIDSVLKELEQAGCKADVLEADVSNAVDVQRVVDHTISRYGAIHGLVNNAAIGPLGTVLTTEEQVFEKIFDVNVKGTYLMSRAALPHMIRAGGGSIVNIGSGAGYGKPNMAAYAASKGAIVALTMAMAYDHFHDRIRVNVAIPGGGGIVSGMSVGRMGGNIDAFVRKPVPGTVAGRPATGRDLANAVAFLMSDEAATISGTVIDVGCFAYQGGPIAPKP